MIMEILAWLTVIGLPSALIALIVYGIYCSFKRSAPSPLKDMKVETPEWNSIDVESFLREDSDIPVQSGTRVWRIYRSADGINWVECDPALTERAACNYADYIKRSNPNDFVRCNDPNGITLFYE